MCDWDRTIFPLCVVNDRLYTPPEGVNFDRQRAYRSGALLNESPERRRRWMAMRHGACQPIRS